ncbi:MAG TPA: hypothetical protein VGM90_25860 [Kofleriaceae bacterium]|jgi:hypothetical protein
MTKLALLALVLTACTTSSDDTTDLAEESVDSALTGQSEAAVLGQLTTGLTATTTTEAAAQIGANASFAPTGCATVTTSGLTTTVVLDHCTGTYGLVMVDGTIRVTITAATATSVSFTAQADALSVDGATLDLDANATYHSSGGSTSLSVTSHSTGSGPAGHALTHDATYTATIDASCASVDGNWETAGDENASLAIQVRRCSAGCPTGTVARERASGGAISITFDGSATAVWSSTRSRTGTVPLACTP